MSRNDITGDEIKTKVTTSTYRDNYDLIFGGGKALYKRESKNYKTRLDWDQLAPETKEYWNESARARCRDNNKEQGEPIHCKQQTCECGLEFQ